MPLITPLLPPLMLILIWFTLDAISVAAAFIFLSLAADMMLPYAMPFAAADYASARRCVTRIHDIIHMLPLLRYDTICRVMRHALARYLAACRLMPLMVFLQRLCARHACYAVTLMPA